jgi:uridine phosphorylase
VTRPRRRTAESGTRGAGRGSGHTAATPLLEFDGEPEALIEPSRIIRPIEIPERCVLSMYYTVIAKLAAESRLTHVTDIETSMGPLPVYRMDHGNTPIAVALPGLTAPFAAIFMEELIALGCRTFVASGGSGVLDASIHRGMVVVPDKAVRDEGTSYHYLAPAREVEADRNVVETIVATLHRHGVPFRVGKTWTTDGIYRETLPRIAKRKAEGCLTVEMECAALLAVARFRGVRFGQLLAAGDDVSGEEWDRRGYGSAEYMRFSDRLFWLAVEACVALP